MVESGICPLATAPPAEAGRRRRRFQPRTWQAVIGLILVLLLTGTAVCVPLLPLGDPIQTDYDHVLEPASRQHWLGTDLHGRDQLSRLFWAARNSLAIGLASTVVALLAGMAVGGMAGLGGPFLSLTLMRVCDVFLSFPMVLGAIALVAVWGPGGKNVFFAFALFTWPLFARVFRSALLAVKNQPFVKAVRLAGASRLRLFCWHLLPNAVAPLASYAALNVAGAIIAEAGLSYVNLGVQRPEPSWGLMLADSMSQLEAAPWLVMAPGAAIAVTALSFMLIGAGVTGTIVERGKPFGRA